MKKLNLLSKAEMKKVTGGVEAIDCADWRSKEWNLCWACCNTVHTGDDCLKSSNCGPLVIIN